MKFKAKGYLYTGEQNIVEVEEVDYWISGYDVCTFAKSKGIETEGKRTDEYGIDGEEVVVIVHRDENGLWAELA